MTWQSRHGPRAVHESSATWRKLYEIIGIITWNWNKSSQSFRLPAILFWVLDSRCLFRALAVPIQVCFRSTLPCPVRESASTTTKHTAPDNEVCHLDNEVCHTTTKQQTKKSTKNKNIICVRLKKVEEEKEKRGGTTEITERNRRKRHWNLGGKWITPECWTQHSHIISHTNTGRLAVECTGRRVSMCFNRTATFVHGESVAGDTQDYGSVGRRNGTVVWKDERKGKGVFRVGWVDTWTRIRVAELGILPVSGAVGTSVERAIALPFANPQPVAARLRTLGPVCPRQPNPVHWRWSRKVYLTFATLQSMSSSVRSLSQSRCSLQKCNHSRTTS